LLTNLGEYQRIDKNGDKIIENEGVSLVSVFNDTEELEIFELDLIKEIIQFKWDLYGMSLHLFGFMVHLVYTIILNVFIMQCYSRAFEPE